MEDKKKNRIIIFSFREKDREEIALSIDYYFRKTFGKFFSYIDIDKFYAIYAPNQENSFGHHYEVFTVFDRRLFEKYPSEPSRRILSERERSYIRKTLFYKSSNAGFIMTEGMCKTEKIPYITYEGEITKREEDLFLLKIESQKEKIQKRLEGILIPPNRF